MQATTQVLDQVAKTTEQIVSAQGFIERLADSISRKLAQRQDTAFDAPLTLKTLKDSDMVAQPQPTAHGRMLVLTLQPLQGATNVGVSVAVKDPALLEQPRLEGRELDNYHVLLYKDELPGDLRTRHAFDFEVGSEDDLREEFARQIASLEIKSAGFFYMNILMLANKEQSHESA